MYASFVCDCKLYKEELYRVRMVVGGNCLNYDKDAFASVASLLEINILINSVISEAEKGARFITHDLKNFYLATPMKKRIHMKIPLHHIPPDINTKMQFTKI